MQLGNTPGMVFLLGCAMALGAVGCADDTDPGATGPATYDEYIHQYFRALCEKAQRCDDSPDYASADQCVEAAAQEIATFHARIAASIDAGKTSYDSAAAKVCLDKLNAGCEVTELEARTYCDAYVIRGQVALGQTCVGFFECADADTVSTNGPWCFDGCIAVYGDEQTQGSGTCVDTYMENEPACQ